MKLPANVLIFKDGRLGNIVGVFFSI